MAMTYDAFLDQMKRDLEAGFAEDLPAKYSQVKIGIRDVEKLQGESYRGISFRVGDAPIEGNLNMQQAYQAYEAGSPYRIRSNRESGDGRYDISLFPRENKYPGMIMELKWDKDLNDEELDALSAEALDQINNKGYDTEMRKEVLDRG